MTTPLERLAMIGDGETVALIGPHASIEWLCLPRFDSPACCALLLGNEDNGHWSIAPRQPITEARHRYRGDTLILETDLTCEEGTIRVTDLMPIRDRDPAIVRIVEGIEGSVAVDLRAAFRFDYGNMPPWLTDDGKAVTAHVGPDKILLWGLHKPDISDGIISERFTIKEGAERVFILAYGAAHEKDPDRPDAQRALGETEQYWREWIGKFQRELPFADAVRRSLITLKALIHRPTGGLVAAATTSLPEKPAGEMNWDYRFCWLRDAAFTVRSLVECGYLDEAQDWRDWILRAVAGAPEKMQIMYRVDGSRRLDEAELHWLPGYRFARPVRIGNSAAGQFQLDVYGEIINMLRLGHDAGLQPVDQGEFLERAIIRHLEEAWKEPDHGIWESRGKPRHYTASKVMAWVAFDRFLSGTASSNLPRRERERLSALRDHIHAVICAEGFNEGLGAFTSFFGGASLDSSLLLLPKVGFLQMSDERMAGTVSQIEKHLVADGLVHRHLSATVVPEGAFLACSFWLAECQLLDGRRSDAVRTLEAAIGKSGDLGLLSEEFDCDSSRLCGNFPQALSHLALISAVLALDRYDRTGQAALPERSQ